MGRIKAIFADIDGTLYSHKTKSVPASARMAVQKARESGILVFAATGRHMLELKDIGFHMELDGWITMNGSLCFNDAGTYYEDPVNVESLRILVEELTREPFPCQFLEKDLMYINLDSMEVRKSLEGINTPMPLILDPARACVEKTYMIIPWVNEERWDQVFSRMHGLKCTRWTPLAADVMSATSGKAKGVLETCKRYGIDPRETMAIGDGPNDIELFESCGFSIAMGNGSEEAKKAADAVTDDIDRDGLAKAFEKYIL